VTVPAGRFLLELPAEAESTFGRQGFNGAGPFIQVLPIPRPAVARAMVAAQARALGVPHEEGGTQLERVMGGRRRNSWFIYFWRDTVFKEATLGLKGYFWRDGLLFVFTGACRPEPGAMADAARSLEDLFGEMRRRAPLEVPPGPGFCLREAYFPGEPAPFSDEHIELLAYFPSRPGVSLRFRTDTVGEVVAGYPRLLAREPAGGSARKRPEVVRLRARERPLGPFPGQELAKRVDQPGGARGWTFMWEYLGRPRDPLSPMLLVELRTGMKKLTSINYNDYETDLLVLWDGILASLRRRESFLRYLRLPGAFRSSLTM
jgi:hypothetical protein